MKITFAFDTTSVTVEQFGDVFYVVDSVAGSVQGRIDYVIKTLEERRRQLWCSYLTKITDLLFCLDFGRINSPQLLADMDDTKLCWIIPQGTTGWVIVPLGLPGWLDTPMTGKSVVALTAMWQQWQKTFPESPDLKEVKEKLEKWQ